MSQAISEGAILRNRYRLLSQIGSGGMSAVWRGEDLSLTRPVAIKVLHDHLRSDTDHQRFQSEALASAKLHHPGIVGVYDTIRDAHVHAVVFEFVEGRTLRAELDTHGTLDPDAAIGIAIEVADALAVAHNQGIVHRDIKPANIMLSSVGRVVVMDFGIAKDADQHDLTTDNLFIGTPKYASPEQVSGGSIDARSDVYSLCAVLYEALCGRPPFSADTDVATAMQRLHESPPALRDHNAALAPELEAIIMRGLKREPQDRHSSINALRNDLANLERGTAGNTRADEVEPFHRSERMWLIPAVFVVVAMVALTVAALLLRQTTTGQRLSDRVEALVGLEEGAGDQVDTTAEGGELVPSFTLDTIGLRAITTYDPFGTGPPGEHDELLPNATDGNSETVWRTETYNDRGFGTKPGVGLILTLDDAALLADLVLSTTSEDWSVSVFVAATVPADFDGWGDPFRQIDAGSGTVTVALDGIEAGVVLIWITDLGVDAQFRLAEVAVTAVA